MPLKGFDEVKERASASFPHFLILLYKFNAHYNVESVDCLINNFVGHLNNYRPEYLRRGESKIHCKNAPVICSFFVAEKICVKFVSLYNEIGQLSGKKENSEQFVV